jgi:GTP-binding protein Era
MTCGFVALVGRPNAGKSTLINRLVGSKVAIVSDKPQTTRNRIVGVKTTADSQVIFVDTPGVHRPLHRMNVRMVDVAVQSMTQSDVVCAVADATEDVGRGDSYLGKMLTRAKAPVVLALNKIDLVEKPKLLPLIEQWSRLAPFAAIVPISALSGDGVDELERILRGHLPEGEPLYPEDYLTDQSERAFVAEVVREKLLHHTRDELPFSTAVAVDQFEEPDDRGLMRLYCTIFVERDSQKAIVIGRGGSMVREIGTLARRRIEEMSGREVYLDLRVKVLKGWRQSEDALRLLGYLPNAR